MIQRRKRIVLFLPHRADPAQGVRVSADLTPLELLQIAAIPDQEGYECVLIDAMVEPDYMAKVMEACDGALCFASSCILGFQVAHGARVAKAVREKFPRLPIIWGGWFPSVVPERYFLEGIADAVGMGQGELTFAEVVRALDAGEDLAKVPGLAVWRDGRMVYTDHRAVVGFDKIPDVPWHLLDFEKYVALQNDKGSGWKLRHKYADPWDMQPGTPLRGFSYYSSYGCPEPCTFCCSPLVTGRRWKAIPGTTLAERVLAVHDRFKFNILRFQDANFGVHEKRSNEFCSALIAAGSPFWWNGTYEIETIARYKDPSLDLLKDSRFHMAALGAEAGSKEQQERIKKKIDIENDLESSLRRLNQRGIQTGVSWIIGYPNESVESMQATRGGRDQVQVPQVALGHLPVPADPGHRGLRRRRQERLPAAAHPRGVGRGARVQVRVRRHRAAAGRGAFVEALRRGVDLLRRTRQGGRRRRAAPDALHVRLAPAQPELLVPHRAEALPHVRARLRQEDAGRHDQEGHHLGRDAQRTRSVTP
jgi:radical SAM superfamily enzyme YgiQ (UPF0313 family)